MRPIQRSLAIAAASLLAAVPLAAQHDHHAMPGQQVGSVSFPTSCRADVQPAFERAVAMLHSFWFDAATAAFDSVAKADDRCAMAHWGAALTLAYNPFTMAAPTEERRVAALAHAERALALATTDRERAWANAVKVLYADPTPGLPGHRKRLQAHEEAMQALRAAYPDDVEATIFYARAVIANAPPTDLTFARQLHAGEILEPLFASRPDHPGLAHYVIHTFDSPKLAKQGLAAARRYAGIAPAAPHALHMPSHIFTRLGYWQESIETNRRSANAEPVPDAAVHPLDYMVYAYLQLGRDDEARKVVDRLLNIEDRFYAGVIGYNLAAMPARYALERSDWARAAALQPVPKAPPFADAVTRFANAVGAARSGDLPRAKAAVAKLEEIRDTLRGRNDAYWATIVEAQRLAASAWVARGERRTTEALQLAKQAADLEETVEKHPVTPGPLLPARELEADLLAALGRHAEALRAYQATMEREPRRARALHGAAVAAAKAGKRADARRYYAELLDLMKEADSARPEPAAARKFLASR
jgi:tetratricopeptide (TPR) repeat protein